LVKLRKATADTTVYKSQTAGFDTFEINEKIEKMFILIRSLNRFQKRKNPTDFLVQPMTSIKNYNSVEMFALEEINNFDNFDFKQWFEQFRNLKQSKLQKQVKKNY
jgi:hypothetical protein